MKAEYDFSNGVRGPILAAAARAMVKFEFACCFCFEAGQVEGDDPIEVIVAGQRDEDGQTFFAHRDCLRHVFHPKAGLEIPGR